MLLVWKLPTRTPSQFLVLSVEKSYFVPSLFLPLKVNPFTFAQTVTDLFLLRLGGNLLSPSLRDLVPPLGWHPLPVLRRK